MSNTAKNTETPDETTWMTDLDGNVIEFVPAEGVISIFAWTVTEDSLGRPSQTSSDTLNLSPDQAIELARRLLNAAAGN